MKKILLLSVLLIGCGSGTEDTTPSVSGTYQCASGCSGSCVFSNLTVTQNDSTIVTVSDFGSCSGTINSDGQYSLQCSSGSTCTGFISGTKATANCGFNTMSCQQATFSKI